MNQELEIRVRTLRLATRAHLLSVTGTDAVQAPSLAEALERVPLDAEVVLNLDGVDPQLAERIGAILRTSLRVRRAVRRVIVVAGDPAIRRALEEGKVVLVEPSLEDGLRYVVGRAWLATLAETGTRPRRAPGESHTA